MLGRDYIKNKISILPPIRNMTINENICFFYIRKKNHSERNVKKKKKTLRNISLFFIKCFRETSSKTFKKGKQTKNTGLIYQSLNALNCIYSWKTDGQTDRRIYN